MTEHTFLLHLGIALIAAFVGGLAARLVRLPVLLGYLIAGIMVGPHTPGVVANTEAVGAVAKLGVALLMFAVGVHFSLKELRALWAHGFSWRRSADPLHHRSGSAPRSGARLGRVRGALSRLRALPLLDRRDAEGAGRARGTGHRAWHRHAGHPDRAGSLPGLDDHSAAIPGAVHHAGRGRAGGDRPGPP